VNIRKYILDSTHSNWFNVWWKDRGSKAEIYYSPYDVIYPSFLKNAIDKNYWYDNIKRYAEISKIGGPAITTLTLSGKELVLTTTLTHHSVAFYEITNSKIAENAG